MKTRLLLALVGISAIAIIALLINHRPTSSSTSSESRQPATPANPRVEVEQPATAVPAAVAGKAVELPGPAATTPEIQTEMETVKFFVRDFRAAFGENPVGNNAEITKALMGANRKQTRFVLPGDARVNARGELVDHWGTPYFFHAISGQEMEIHSAGPDQRMWTGDDIVLR